MVKMVQTTSEAPEAADKADKMALPSGAIMSCAVYAASHQGQQQAHQPPMARQARMALAEAVHPALKA